MHHPVEVKVRPCLERVTEGYDAEMLFMIRKGNIG